MGVWDTQYADAADTVAPSDTLIFYSDGLVERRGESLDMGLQRLSEAAAAGPDEASALCAHVLGTMLPWRCAMTSPQWSCRSARRHCTRSSATALWPLRRPKAETPLRAPAGPAFLRSCVISPHVRFTNARHPQLISKGVST